MLATYLGQDVADHLMRGRIRRGTAARMQAMILFADLRGFTAFSNVAAAECVAQRLDAYLEAMGDPVEAGGGQILKFLGDGLLAIFVAAADEDAQSGAARALSAAKAMLARVGSLNEAAAARGEPQLPLDVALHNGEVLYGNVGTGRRLDFTVIGRAVNEAARLERLCRDVDAHLLISDTFRRSAGALGRGFVSLGRHSLPGVAGAREIFTTRVA
jgi:adenylate cyclase